MRKGLWIGLVAGLAALGSLGISAGEDVLSKRDTGGGVSVIVTLAGPPAVGVPIEVTVKLDTHSVALDGVKFEEAVAMRGVDGTDVAPKVGRISGSGHHREAALSFPPLSGTTHEIRIAVRNVGGVAERSFVWEVPATR